MATNLPAKRGDIPDPLASQISLAEHATLEELEGLVEAALDQESTAAKGYVALAWIHDHGLYKGSSFEGYAFARFGISASSAKRWLNVGKWILAEAAAGRSVAKPPSQRKLSPSPKTSRSRGTAPRTPDIPKPTIPEPVVIPATSTETRPEDTHDVSDRHQQSGVESPSKEGTQGGAERTGQEGLVPEAPVEALNGGYQPAPKELLNALLHTRTEALAALAEEQPAKVREKVARRLRLIAESFDPTPAPKPAAPMVPESLRRNDVQTRFKKRDAPVEKGTAK